MARSEVAIWVTLPTFWRRISEASVAHGHCPARHARIYNACTEPTDFLITTWDYICYLWWTVNVHVPGGASRRRDGIPSLIDVHGLACRPATALSEGYSLTNAAMAQRPSTAQWTHTPAGPVRRVVLGTKCSGIVFLVVPCLMGNISVRGVKLHRFGLPFADCVIAGVLA